MASDDDETKPSEEDVVPPWNELGRIRYLQLALQHCEEKIEKSGKPRDAWRMLALTGRGPRRGVSFGWDAKELLGPDHQIIKRGTPRDQLPTYQPLRKLAEALSVREGIGHLEAMSRVMAENPELTERFRREAARNAGEARITPAWRYATLAAHMAAALDNPDDPDLMFAAGIAYGEDRQLDHQLKRKYCEQRESKRLSAQKESRKKAQYGHKKAGKLAPQTRVIRAAVKVLGPLANAESVLAILTKEPLMDAEDDKLDEILNELAKTGENLDPVEARTEGALVEVEEPHVYFRFLNRSDRKMTLARFRNAVSEAMGSKQLNARSR